MDKKKENKRAIKGKRKDFLLTEEQGNKMLDLVQKIGMVSTQLDRLSRKNSSKVTLGAGIGEAKSCLNQYFNEMDDLMAIGFGHPYEVFKSSQE